MSSSSSLSKAELIAAVSLTAGATAVGILVYQTFFSKRKCSKPKVNLDLQKDNPKVVHAFDIEDLGDKAVYCRCWRSKKFPYCDGAHTKHNQETGDNVGPLIIKRKEAWGQNSQAMMSCLGCFAVHIHTLVFVLLCLFQIGISSVSAPLMVVRYHQSFVQIWKSFQPSCSSFTNVTEYVYCDCLMLYSCMFSFIRSVCVCACVWLVCGKRHSKLH